MASNDAARHSLYAQLEHVLGHEHADTLMSYLPRDRNDEVATRSDIARLEERMDQRFSAMEQRFDQRFVAMEERFDQRFTAMEQRIARMEGRFDRMEERMDRMQRFYVGTTVGSMTALTAMFSLVVTFFG